MKNILQIYHLQELDMSRLFTDEFMGDYQSYMGIFHWCVYLGNIDINFEESFMDQ